MRSQKGPGPTPKAPRPLLPAARDEATTNNNNNSPGAGGPRGLTRSTWTLPPRTKSYSTAACETCRKRKAKCDATRPACGYCVSVGTSCVYNTGSAKETHAQALKRKLSELNNREATYRQIFDHLRSRSEAESREIVKRIRSRADPESILRYITEADLLLQLAVVPETRYRYVFPIIQEMPAVLNRPDNPYLKSPIYEWAVSRGPSPAAQGPQLLLPGDTTRSLEPQSPYLKPIHAAELVDPVLSSTKPSDWTRVSSDDGLMRELLALYFSSEYQWLPIFQKDHFLQDMATGRHNFCSPLLVNAVLALASMSHDKLPNRYEYWNPWNLCYKFFAEAERLWELETASRRVQLTSIQAGLLLDLVRRMHAMEALKRPYSYMEQAVEMAKKIRLFDSDSDTMSAKADVKTTRARQFSAWGVFNYQSICAYVSFGLPLLPELPNLPLPPDPSLDPEWYGQTWLRYPLDGKLYTTNFPHYFRALTEMRIIMNDMCIQLFGSADSTAEYLSKANEFCSRLRNWYTNLPEPLRPENLVFPSHMLLHANYQTILINLYESLCTAESPQLETHLPQSQTNNPSKDSPWEIRTTAMRNLETVLRLYYLRHGFVRGDSFLGHPLNLLALTSLRQLLNTTTTTSSSFPSNPDLATTRATLILAAKGIYDQGRNYFINHAVLRLIKQKMGGVEREMLGRVIGESAREEEGGHGHGGVWDVDNPGEEEVLRKVRSKVLPLAVGFGEDPEVNRLEYLIERDLKLLNLEGDHGGGEEETWREGGGDGDGHRGRDGEVDGCVDGTGEGN